MSAATSKVELMRAPQITRSHYRELFTFTHLSSLDVMNIRIQNVSRSCEVLLSSILEH